MENWKQKKDTLLDGSIPVLRKIERIQQNTTASGSFIEFLLSDGLMLGFLPLWQLTLKKELRFYFF